MANYRRERNGRRFLLEGGMNTVKSVDLLTEGEYAYLQNVRRQLSGRIGERPTSGSPVYTLVGTPNTIVRMNDSSPSGPVSGFVRLIGAKVLSTGVMYADSTEAASGFIDDPMTILPFGPNQSVQPWAYTGDSSSRVVISATHQICTGMVKVRSDGLTYKTGIEEPQLAPRVGVNTTTITDWLTLPANTPPWTNIGGINANYNYTGTDQQPPFPATILTPIAGSTVSITVTGTATVNGTPGTAPSASGPTSSGYPGAFIASAKIVVFALTDANGNVLAQSSEVGAPKVVGNVGSGTTLTVPSGAARLQLGIDSHGGTFAANSGSYTVSASVSTNAVAATTGIVGEITAYVWGDSPHSGPVGNYIWSNPSDNTGNPRTIGTAQVVNTNNSLIFDSSPEDDTVPVVWDTLDQTGANIGSINLFDPALESAGYQDFNCCIVGSIFFPSAGTYKVSIQYKDQMMFGMGGGVVVIGSITQTGGGESPNTLYPPVVGSFGQTITVADALPVLDVGRVDGTTTENTFQTDTFSIQVPQQGVYPFEIDWDYWKHTGRSLIVEMGPTAGANVATIPPLPQGVRTNVVYWGKYRSSDTGAQSNPGPASPIQQTPVLANTLTMPFSSDPQVDKCDYYRQDEGLPNPTYVITGPNDGMGPVVNGVQYNSVVTDTLTDLGAAANQQMQTDDFEPFPSIDTPKAGVVTIVDGVITWKSGDQFNTRWLPGTLMLIGSPSQNAYSLVARPISATQIVIPGIPDNIGDDAGDGVPYNIAQPFLAQQAIPSMWGPDAFGYMHACGDSNQPEAYLWTKANNPDSAPQTNRLLLTSPSEALMGGGIVHGVSMVFSTLRSWLMYPNFADAQATTEGTSGTPWNPIPATTTKGLYIRNCLCVIGGKSIAFRASDGICITSGGAEQSLTDERLYNLFPHENFAPQPVTIGPYVVYPPDDTKPQALVYQTGYIYWDYTGTDGNPHTLVFDEAAKGWSVDVGNPAFTCHGIDYGEGVSDTAVGCIDHTIRLLAAGAGEVATSAVATGSDNGGDARALKRVGDVFVRALVAPTAPIAAAFYSSLYQTPLGGLGPSPLDGTGVVEPYILDGGGAAIDVADISMVLSWATGAGNELDLWQPTLMPLPAAILSRRTDGISVGKGYQHVYLVNFTFAATSSVTLILNTDQGIFTQTWPGSGTLATLTKVMQKFSPNKFKVCEYQIVSSQAFYLFQSEIWVGEWGRPGPYQIIDPFTTERAGL